MQVFISHYIFSFTPLETPVVQIIYSGKKRDISNMLTNVFICLLCLLFKSFFKTLPVFSLDFDVKH